MWTVRSPPIGSVVVVWPLVVQLLGIPSSCSKAITSRLRPATSVDNDSFSMPSTEQQNNALVLLTIILSDRPIIDYVHQISRDNHSSVSLNAWKQVHQAVNRQVNGEIFHGQAK